MANQTGDHGHDRAAVLMQAELVLQGLFADSLALLEGLGVVVFGNVRVGGRVKDIDVNTVQNAAQLILLLAQQAVQTVAEPRVEDLLRVGRADGGDLVCTLDGALHEVGAAVILHNMGVTCADAAGILENIQTILSLVGNVVDREHRLDAAELIQMAVVQVQVDGRQCGLPVIAVDDVRLKVGVEQHLQNGAGEERETFAVVIEAVQAAALEVILVVDEVKDNAVALGLEQAAVLAAPAHGHAEVGDIGQRILEFQVAVQRHNDAGVDAVADQRLGQSARNIGQAAGLGKGCSLAGCVQDFHKHLRASFTK